MLQQHLNAMHFYRSKWLQMAGLLVTISVTGLQATGAMQCNPPHTYVLEVLVAISNRNYLKWHNRLGGCIRIVLGIELHTLILNC